MSYNFEYMSPLWNVLPGDIANMLVGRQEYLSQILRAFNNGAKVVQVIGPGGIGKTTLLALYARHVDKLYEGRVYGSYPSAVESPNELVTRVLPGIPQENTLLVIDEVDRLSNNDLSELEHVIKQSSNIHILTVSRSPLSGLSKLSSIYLEGFTKEEFREAMTLRSAIANNIIDYPEINRLFALSGGNPLLEAVQKLNYLSYL